MCVKSTDAIFHLCFYFMTREMMCIHAEWDQLIVSQTDSELELL